MKASTKNTLEAKAGACVAGLKNASAVYGRVISASLEKNGLRASYMRVLEPLTQNKNLTQLELVKITGLKAPTISITLRNMEREGIVSRVKKSDDRRETHVAITERGRALYFKVTAAIKKVEKDMLKNISEDEKDVLCAILEKISQNLNKML